MWLKHYPPAFETMSIHKKYLMFRPTQSFPGCCFSNEKVAMFGRKSCVNFDKKQYKKT